MRGSRREDGTRRPAAVALALAVAVVLAGCGSVGLGADDPGTPFAPPDETPTVETRTPSAATTTGPRGALPADAVERHVAARDGRSLTIRWTDETVRGDRTVPSETVARVAPDGDYRLTTRVGNVTASVYVVDGELYERYAANGSVQYFHRTLGEPRRTPHGEFLTTLRAVVPTGTWERRGTGTTPDGVAVTRYSASVPAIELAAITGSRATVTLAIGPEGIVRGVTTRYWVDTFDGPRRVTRTARITGVGETVVEPPSWFAEAKNRTTKSTDA